MSDVAQRVSIDRTSPVPLYFQLAESIQRVIETGGILPGALLGNEIHLADELGVSRPTMRKAIEYLVQRGLLVRRRGIGTQVVRAQVRRPLELTSLHDDLASAGRRPRTEVLDLDTVEADERAAAALAVPQGSPTVRLRRLRYADDEPIALLTNFLPPNLLPLDEAALADRGLYELMRSARVHIHAADQSIGAKVATAGEARLLGERRSAALLTMTRTAYDDAGRAVEYGTHLYRASVYAFSVSLVER